MRLAACVPPLPAELVACFEKCGIRTDADLLFSSPVIDIFRRLPSGTVSLHDLTKYVELVAELASAPGVSGPDLLKQAQEKQDTGSKFPTGMLELDEIVDGFNGGRVYEISGGRHSGKTGLALHVVLRHLMQNPQSNILWMDTTGEFSVPRATELLNSFDLETPTTALERLQVSLVFDIDAAHELLDNLSSSFDVGKSRHQIRCIVVDTITPLLGPLLTAVSAQGHATMTSFMRRLKDLAQKYMLAIFVINNATISHLGNVRKPALGPSFAFMTDATIWLCRYEGSENDNDETGSVYVAEVLRSKTTRSGTRCSFKIDRGKLLPA
ncbi:P-loop containing nucleoside triphosphate hydrolase protein [Collybia nuda]|uniref:P-loop containing nucleoside triphosphate hydrolase protein n=1 Tax=Collybia nuda TaxID=64659 RepID=A0A9P6CN12_9AGAR|nr:P-loop containing nucleoside triphosphate hydrolase protein [Collybia nuda]